MLESIKKIEEETKEAIKFKDMLESVQKSIYDKKLKIIMYRRKIEDLQKTFDMTQSTMAKFKQDVIKVILISHYLALWFYFLLLAKISMSGAGGRTPEKWGFTIYRQI